VHKVKVDVGALLQSLPCLLEVSCLFQMLRLE
jgi:hypothetical protein